MSKIIITANSAWNLFNFRYNLAKKLQNSGYKVILIAPRDKYSDNLSKEFEYYDVYMNSKGVSPIEDIKTTLNYYTLYKKLKPNVVLNFTIKPNIYSAIACSLLGIKVINNITGLGTLFIKPNITTKLAKFLYKFSLKKTKQVFFQNKDDFKLFINNGLVEKYKCDILPGSGVDIEKFIPVVQTRKDNIFRFLLIARMLWDKGIGEYVSAAKSIKNNKIEFLLLGATGVNNPTVINIKQIKLWEQAGIIKYLGVTDNVKNVIIKADCIVLPSYREGTPKSLLEACAMAKPIITTNVAGCKDVVDDGINGYLCQVKNTKDLACKMEMMINLSAKQKIAMGLAGREKMIKEFDEKIVINKYLKAIQIINN